MAETEKVEKTGRIHKTEVEWRALLTPEQFHIIRERELNGPLPERC